MKFYYNHVKELRYSPLSLDDGPCFVLGFLVLFPIITAGALIGALSGVLLVSFGVAATGAGSFDIVSSLGVAMNWGGCWAVEALGVATSSGFPGGASNTVLGR